MYMNDVHECVYMSVIGAVAGTAASVMRKVLPSAILWLMAMVRVGFVVRMSSLTRQTTVTSRVNEYMYTNLTVLHVV